MAKKRERRSTPGRQSTRFGSLTQCAGAVSSADSPVKPNRKLTTGAVFIFFMVFPAISLVFYGTRFSWNTKAVSIIPDRPYAYQERFVTTEVNYLQVLAVCSLFQFFFVILSLIGSGFNFLEFKVGNFQKKKIFRRIWRLRSIRVVGILQIQSWPTLLHGIWFFRLMLFQHMAFVKYRSKFLKMYCLVANHWLFWSLALDTFAGIHRGMRWPWNTTINLLICLLCGMN